MNKPLNLEKKESALKRWYDFNKQTIPLFFIVIGVFFFTAFLDFEIQGTNIILRSHISAIQKFLNTPRNNLSGFYLFSMYLIALIQLFNGVSYTKTRSKFTTILINFLSVLQAIIAILYTSNFFYEQATRVDYVIDQAATLAYTVSLIGAVFFVIASVLTWFYVNWHYVKEVD